MQILHKEDFSKITRCFLRDDNYTVHIFNGQMKYLNSRIIDHDFIQEDEAISLLRKTFEEIGAILSNEEIANGVPFDENEICLLRKIFNEGAAQPYNLPSNFF